MSRGPSRRASVCVDPFFRARMADQQHATKRSRLSPEAITSKRLRSMWMDREYADAEVECGDASWPVHRGVLASASGVLARMLGSEFREAKTRKVNLKDADPEAIGSMLEFIYTGDAPVLREHRKCWRARWTNKDSSGLGQLYEIKNDGRTTSKQCKTDKIAICHERSGRCLQGVYVARMRIDSVAASDHYDGIGFDLDFEQIQSNFPSVSLRRNNAVCLSSSGQIFVHGDSRARAPPLLLGDVVTLTLDGTKQTITFDINDGKLQVTEPCAFDATSLPRLAVCFRKVGWQVTVLDRLDEGSKILALLTAAHMYEVRDLVATCVTQTIDRSMIDEENVVAVLRAARDLRADGEFEDPLPILQQLVAGDERLFRAVCRHL